MLGWHKIGNISLLAERLVRRVTTMPEMKGITVKITADLHAEVKAYLGAHGMTMGGFMSM